MLSVEEILDRGHHGVGVVGTGPLCVELFQRRLRELGIGYVLLQVGLSY